jgi:hypothetical protein
MPSSILRCYSMGLNPFEWLNLWSFGHFFIIITNLLEFSIPNQQYFKHVMTFAILKIKSRTIWHYFLPFHITLWHGWAPLYIHILMFLPKANKRESKISMVILGLFVKVAMAFTLQNGHIWIGNILKFCK